MGERSFEDRIVKQEGTRLGDLENSQPIHVGKKEKLVLKRTLRRGKATI